MPSTATFQSTLTRAIQWEHQELSRGLWVLPVAARLLPMLAMFETTGFLMFALRGTSGERTAVLHALAMESASALLPLLLGFTAAVIAQAGHIYFEATLQDMLREMYSVASDIQTWSQR